ncbi:protein chibby homolog 1 isoform X1 [Macaca nemestrina]|uniref:protein chibby homolog 1 isoform X1 n=1 Tax=Macaca nemestrina TaxID=9545 RepID=UPI0039B9B7E0
MKAKGSSLVFLELKHYYYSSLQRKKPKPKEDKCWGRTVGEQQSDHWKPGAPPSLPLCRARSPPGVSLERRSPSAKGTVCTSSARGCPRIPGSQPSCLWIIRSDLKGEGSVGFAFIRPKMPFFGNTFSPKKTPPRKSASLSNLHSLDRSAREVELGLEYGSPTMNLAGQSLKFENGQWIAETGVSGGVDRREVQRLRRRNQQLEEENNLLRLKVDILLDMLSESTAESHLMEKELDELRISRKRK